MAVRLKICFGSRQIWIEHIKSTSVPNFILLDQLARLPPLQTVHEAIKGGLLKGQRSFCICMSTSADQGSAI